VYRLRAARQYRAAQTDQSAQPVSIPRTFPCRGSPPSPALGRPSQSPRSRDDRRRHGGGPSTPQPRTTKNPPKRGFDKSLELDLVPRGAPTPTQSHKGKGDERKSTRRGHRSSLAETEVVNEVHTARGCRARTNPRPIQAKVTDHAEELRNIAGRQRRVEHIAGGIHHI